MWTGELSRVGVAELRFTLEETLRLFKELKLTKAQQQVAGEVLREIGNRLQFLVDVGLEYLTLGRPAPTLSRRSNLP